ncbi:inner-membrane translocator [Gluconacetobacter diazotrophicus PA1 5]|uniref:ABC transporter permease n=2 Tax=Gluconacetobacter diazotrophicus TaxID=33996 RepID=A0A7W4I8G1_GLUDI|nr:ABC transporter permease [Gluconacetobacter diazotrophicus]ACI50692.1 inner-membrane translocator [Gluconacetobacter diazotrophicus PA1 5]MBB2158149.1 ABC transporter permease [Gluconacetobacter diazotrophicus]TWA99898.1 nucleoside ABC transporter membrane protein [Gluconacetobacter diazotrophicus]CAP56635.1 putative amino acid transporter [Gluconacetobacter diazotrophicus PA1 5]
MNGALRLYWLTSSLLALMFATAIITLSGFNPMHVLSVIVQAAFGSAAALAETCSAAAPLILTAVAAALSFRSGIFNVGIEGCFVLGGLTSAVTATYLPILPSPFLVTMTLLAGMGAGAAWMVLPAVLYACLGVDEIVTTLMLNFVAQAVADGLVQQFFLAPGSANSATAMVPVASRVPHLLASGTLDGSFFVGLLVIVSYGLWARYTVSGFETRIMGRNRRFAAAVGLPRTRLLIGTMVVSGAVGGLGGGLHVLGNLHRFVAGFSSNYGFMGLAVAILGANHAFPMAVAAMALGALNVAGIGVQLLAGLPEEVVDLIVGSVIIFSSARLTFGRPDMSSLARGAE